MSVDPAVEQADAETDLPEVAVDEKPTELASYELPYKFDRDSTAAELKEKFDHIETGTESGTKAAIAGRLMLRRVQGKLAFGTLADSSGRIQLFAPGKVTPDFEKFCALSLGDWIGVSGEVMKTKRGELSVKVEQWTLLAKAQRPFPDKYHGISDTELRYRRRYMDLWVTPESREVFQARSRIVSRIRSWLEERDFMEVETPIFHPVPGGALARPFTTQHNALDEEFYLRIAPELYLKRLVAGGFERVFEIGRTFRNEGISNRHNPEFTMLEMYQAYGDYNDFMETTENLVSELAELVTGSTIIEYGDKQVDLKTPWRRATMTELIGEHVGDEMSIEMDLEAAQKIASSHGVHIKDSYGVGKLILETYEKVVESNIWDPVFVIDYPKEVSPLSRVHRDNPGLTERFEAVVVGRELANGFSELIDPIDQRERFEDQAQQKIDGDDEAMAVDEDYLRAMEYGLPPTVGLGIGIDRLVMLLTNSANIRDVVLFPTLRKEVFDS